MSPHVKNTRAASDSSVGLSGMVARKEERLQLPGASSSELLLGDRESLRRRRRDIPSAGHARVKKAQMLEEAARLDMRVGCSGERCGAWSHCATANDVWCRRHYCGLLWVLLLPVFAKIFCLRIYTLLPLLAAVLSLSLRQTPSDTWCLVNVIFGPACWPL